MSTGAPSFAHPSQEPSQGLAEAIASRAVPTHVVGIGASAGGLEALEAFFDHLPHGLGMAFVVVQHLSPDFKSMMDELLARHTRLPIRLVEDAMVVEPDHVYLIPSRREMIISGGCLLLSEKERQQDFPLPIDVFFRSLAQECGPRAVAIVLSGGGTDGSRGVRDVHEAGGLVLVQDVDSAQFDGMPKTARDAGVAHFVLPPAEMPRILGEHAERASRLPYETTLARRDGDPAPKGVDAIYQLLERQFGLDFTLYKPSTVTRRIERRLTLARSQDLEHYVEQLRSQKDELDVLYRDLLIGVTRFFRNEEAFAELEERVLPELWERLPRGAPVRLWVAGCATGEEAYSLAILLADTMQRLGERPIKLFATDVHAGSLERAARAIYDADAVARVSPERLERYFHRIASDVFQVRPEIRQMVVFAAHNVIRDAPFTRVDFVSCRNLLIYLQPAAQQKALALFHFALNRGGILFLGPSESPGHLARDFETLDKHWRLYRKFSDARIPVDARFQPTARTPFTAVSAASGATRQSLTQLLGTYDALLERYVPPALLLTEHGELVHAFGGASRFLTGGDGRQSLDVMERIDPELRTVLVCGMRRALLESGTTSFSGIRLRDGDESSTYRVSMFRIAGKGPAGPHALVTFEREAGLASARTVIEMNVDEASREELGVLQAELLATKENLQSAIEELQTSNEELQAANEELLASNEELQSTNEELQSVNEELYTVNAEYQRKISELTALTNDMDNLLSSTDVGTIFLDKDLRIRRFTPQIGETLRLVPHDVGRSIETFAHSMEYPQLVDDLKRCLSSCQPVERELREVKGKSYFLRILPYRAKGTIDGVVLTLIDVSGLKAAEDALFHERHLFDSLIRSLPDAMYFRDARGRFIRANEPMAARLGVADARAVVGKTAYELTDERAARTLLGADETILETGVASVYQVEKRQTDGGADAWESVTRLPIKDQAGEVVGVIGMFRDVTELKHTEEKLREEMRRRDQFLAMLSHELRNPLSAILTSTELLKTDAGGSAERRTRVMGVLDRQSLQMARLLDDLLEASRITQNKIELQLRVFDLRTAMNDAADAIRPSMEARGIAFSVSAPKTPTLVDGDPARLAQILMNLLNNAAKYTPRGGHVSLGLSIEDRELVLRVKDDGVGIPQPMLDSIFELFVQSRRTLDRADGGLGLGLTLVRSLATMHGGSVSVKSAGEGQGSEFVVRLPHARGALEPSGHHPALRAPPPRGAKVAVIEDNADSRQVLTEFLELFGYECQSTGNGAEGLALIERTRAQLAIIDLGLPGIDGLELARRLRSDPRFADAYLIALTGYGQPSDRAASKEAGFDEHLVKPVRLEQLLSRLSAHEERIEGS